MGVDGAMLVAVRDGGGVRVGGIGERVGEGVMVGVEVTGLPVTVKRPLDLNCWPTKICTSYSPGSHASGA